MTSYYLKLVLKSKQPSVFIELLQKMFYEYRHTKKMYTMTQRKVYAKKKKKRICHWNMKHCYLSYWVLSIPDLNLPDLNLVFCNCQNWGLQNTSNDVFNLKKTRMWGGELGKHLYIVFIYLKAVAQKLMFFAEVKDAVMKIIQC